MKKFLKAALVILVLAAFGPGARAFAEAKTHPQLTQAQVDQLRADQKQRHQRKSKPAARKVEGMATRGANRVSPDPVKNYF